MTRAGVPLSFAHSSGVICRLGQWRASPDVKSAVSNCPHAPTGRRTPWGTAQQAQGENGRRRQQGGRRYSLLYSGTGGPVVEGVELSPVHAKVQRAQPLEIRRQSVAGPDVGDLHLHRPAAAPGSAAPLRRKRQLPLAVPSAFRSRSTSRRTQRGASSAATPLRVSERPLKAARASSDSWCQGMHVNITTVASGAPLER